MIRARLKAATHEVHERLHAHDGFAAAAGGTISAADYRDLLARLYGFHAPFDVAMTLAPSDLSEDLELPARARDGALAADLTGLGVRPGTLSKLPRAALPPLRGEGAFLGALYVVEGSTMGGTLIARALTAFGENRRFYLGHGGDNGRMWRHFVTRLDRLDGEGAEAAERAALEIFAAFEDWMRDWRGALVRPEAELAR